jgi:hypothetical protein
LISETSAEDNHRVEWLSYVGEQVRLALQAGVPLEGLCWYPIVDYPGWENDRACQTGLWGTCDEDGSRPIHEPLRNELVIQSALIKEMQKSFPFPGPDSNFAGRTDQNADLTYGSENSIFL